MKKDDLDYMIGGISFWICMFMIVLIIILIFADRLRETILGHAMLSVVIFGVVIIGLLWIQEIVEFIYKTMTADNKDLPKSKIIVKS